MVEVYGVLLLRQALLPVGGQELALLGDGVDVGGERERHDVGIEPVDHGAGLLARAAVRLLDVTFSPPFACHCLANAALNSW